MKRLYDIMITTQVATIIAALAMYAAHLVSVQANEHWNFAIYVLLAVATMFMAFPYLITDDRDVTALEVENKRQQQEIQDLIEDITELAKENGTYS